MAECTSGKLTVLVMNEAEADCLSQLFIDHAPEVHADPDLESVALALGAL